MSNFEIRRILDKYGRIGVDALAAATPVQSGTTAGSWFYTVEGGAGSASIVWHNNHTNKGVNIAVILQFGHGTGTGGYVEATNYIPPAIQPVFEQIAAAVWQEVMSA